MFLSLKTIHGFDNIRKVMENGYDDGDIGNDKEGSVSETDEPLDRFNDLLP
jgi:hypothetical protein